MQPEKMLELQAEWTPIMEGWSDELLAIIVQNGVIPGTREAINSLSEIAKEFLSTQTDPELMVDIVKIKNRSRVLNIVVGILATLSGLLRANNLRGLVSLAKVCNKELSTMYSEEPTSEAVARMDSPSAASLTNL